MSLPGTTTDFINWAYLLKGNYRKGVHRLREIMGTPEQAQALCSNAGALCLILGHDPAVPDANSEELRGILLDGRYTDLAIENWLPLVFEDTIENIVSNKTTVAAIIAGSSTAPAIAASDKWLAKCLCTLAETSAASINSLADLIANTSALTAVLNSTSAISTVANSEKLLLLILNDEDAKDSLLGNSTAMGIIADTPAAIAVITATLDADELFDNDSLFNIVKNDSTFAQNVATSHASTFTSDSWAVVNKLATLAKVNPSAFASYKNKKRSIAISGNGTHSFTVSDVNVKGAGFLFVCDDLVGTHRMNASNTTSGGWEGCEMRSWLGSTMLNNFPSDLRSVIKAVSNQNTSGYGAATTSDKLWIPSFTEVGLQSGSAEGAKFSIFNSNSDRIRKNGGSATYWWLRSVNGSNGFRDVQLQRLVRQRGLPLLLHLVICTPSPYLGLGGGQGELCLYRKANEKPQRWSTSPQQGNSRRRCSAIATGCPRGTPSSSETRCLSTRRRWCST